MELRVFEAPPGLILTYRGWDEQKARDGAAVCTMGRAGLWASEGGTFPGPTGLNRCFGLEYRVPVPDAGPAGIARNSYRRSLF